MRLAIAVAGALLLAGCPIPQPLPDYPPGTITPPRIVVDNSLSQISSPDSVVRVPANCSQPPTYPLDAQIRDANTIEPIEARWFVNYDASTQPGFTWEQREEVTLTDPNDPTLRDLTPYTFPPYDYLSVAGNVAGSAEGALHIVELVVSNGFHVAGADEPLPNRSPAPGFEIQLYRWVFLNVLEPGGCTAGAPGCCP
jgi:hypothetical protein